MDRAEALKLLKSYISVPHNLHHALESEAVMRKLAEKLGEDAEKWALCGLLHDLDFEYVNEDPNRHGLVTEKILLKSSIDEEIARAIPCHNYEYTNRTPVTVMERALIPAETVTGLIVACVLVRPDKNISAIPLKSIRKKFKNLAFARNVSRDAIRTVEGLGVPLDDFLILARDAIAEIQSDIGIPTE